ncbi:MAG: 2-oxo acid dehydrogenase subunit E2, partial [Bacteroidales bacterium]|nr:2-oxo acid dehydrogenase subunit E2 [Bacteroidales bacterium]
MNYIFKFPDIGEGLDEGTILEWYVKKGEKVESSQPIVKMETDKVVTDIPSPRTGIIVAIYGKEGETIKVGDVLVEIEIEGLEGEAAQQEVAKINSEFEAVEEEGAGVVGTLEIAGNNAFLPVSDEASEVKTEQETVKKKALATPVARAYAKELNIDINEVIGTGPNGRVMKDDIEKHRHKYAETSATQIVADEMPVEIEKMSQLRKTIARNMLNSKHNAAHMSVFDDAEISELIRVRQKLRDELKDQGIKLSYLPFVIKAVAQALKKYKALNAEMDFDKGVIIYKKFYNIGIAVDTPDGLVVPVIRNADKKSISEIALELNAISEKARNRELSLNDMKDGTFTITSFGSIGGKYAVPVINYP